MNLVMIGEKMVVDMDKIVYCSRYETGAIYLYAIGDLDHPVIAVIGPEAERLWEYYLKPRAYSLEEKQWL